MVKQRSKGTKNRTPDAAATPREEPTQYSAPFKWLWVVALVVLVLSLIGGYVIHRRDALAQDAAQQVAQQEAELLKRENERWMGTEFRKVYAPYMAKFKLMDEEVKIGETTTLETTCAEFAKRSPFNDSYSLFPAARECYNNSILQQLKTTLGPRFIGIQDAYIVQYRRTSQDEWDEYIKLRMNDAIYYSEAIEGTSLNSQTAYEILKDGNIQGCSNCYVRDIFSLKNHQHAVSLLQSAIIDKGNVVRNLTHETLFQVHKELLASRVSHKDVVPGEYRSGHVTVNGKVLFPFFCEVEPLMDHYLEWYNLCLADLTKSFGVLYSTPDGYKKIANVTLAVVVFAVEAMTKFVQIHPFGDGNGRLSRALMNLVFVAIGVPPLEMVDEVDDYGRKVYYQALAQAFQGDKESLMTMHVKIVGRALEKFTKLQQL